MGSYIEKRLKEIREMPAEEAAKSRIRSSTHPRVKAAILAARKKTDGSPSNVPKGLKDGDVLLLRNAGGFYDNVIAGVTSSPHTHAAIVAKGKVYDVLAREENEFGKTQKARAGGNINTLEEFAKRDKGLTYDVYRPKDQAAAREATRNAERITRQTKGYSYANAVSAGLRDRLGFGITANYDKNYKICSELVYDCFNGTIGNDAGSSVSPGRIAKNKNLENVASLKLSIIDLLSDVNDDDVC